jgi:hypothetical protein
MIRCAVDDGELFAVEKEAWRKGCGGKEVLEGLVGCEVLEGVS